MIRASGLAFVLLLATGPSGPQTAVAQYYGSPAGIFGGLMNGMAAQQQRAARDQERAAQAYRNQRDAADAQARAAQAQADADARQQEFSRQQASQQAAAAARAKQAAIARERSLASAAASQAAAEQSESNYCAKPDVARVVMEQFNQFQTFKTRRVEVIDIEHLTTVAWTPERSQMTCHGDFVTNNGLHLRGTFEIKKNVAGDPIYTWKMDR